MNEKLVWLLIGAAILVALALAALLRKDGLKRDKTVKKAGGPNGKQVETGADRAGAPADYDRYIMPKREKAIHTAAAAAAIFAAGYVFYRNPAISLCMTPLALLYPKYKTREIIRKRKQALNLQFKEALYALSSSLTAGKSVETAFKEALRDLSVQYPDPATDIIREFECIVRRLEMNETVEDALQDFAGRAHLEDIGSFADVLQICKRSGGNLVQVIRNSTDILNDKIEIRQEIDTLLTERRFEQKVLNIMPVLMIFFISASAGDFMQPVFTTIPGNIVMTLAILLLAAAYVISKKITDIEV